jgi:hypothetical protein
LDKCINFPAVKMDNTQVVAIVIKFLEDHPVERHMGCGYQIIMAVVKAYGTKPRDPVKPCQAI